jgi:NADH-ubiquinone oxidoreductase chain 5
MFMVGLGVNFEYDSRRIIALPTLRQLRLVIMTIPIGLFSLAFFQFLVVVLCD